MRVKFNRKGQQKKFFQKVFINLNCPSLIAFLQYGLDVPYSTLKNYFSESRLIPENFFKDLCYLSKINLESLDIVYLDENWGQVKGGKKSKRK